MVYWNVLEIFDIWGDRLCYDRIYWGCLIFGGTHCGTLEYIGNIRYLGDALRHIRIHWEYSIFAGTHCGILQNVGYTRWGVGV